MSDDRIRSYREFWPYYLRQHADPLNRVAHFAGTAGTLLLIALIIDSGMWGLAVLVPVIGYGPAWLGHYFIEGNRPATFRHPLWALISDFRMAGLMLVSGLDSELDRHGIPRR